ncbi:FecR family protein [Massilia sp. UBA6681]|uniref:FecR family protein n=1 Tax=Massilia sp. UBA6681 TaxID=1946839 RepID=UPI0025BE0E8C|nr:FecR family protein [Massilia sp. UBA6681]
MLRPILIISSLAIAFQAQAAEAGKVIFAAGAAQVADKAGAEGTPVQEGELLSTGKDGFLYIKTIDNGLLILRPNTQAKIVSYRVDQKNPAKTRIKLELISGVARSKSGEAVKLARQNFRFNTPVAAIGVRGTDFTVYTDQETSRVAVLTGGVVVSSFAGNCSPEGAGPCEGAASRELFAGQRGQLLQVKRGAAAPQLVPSNGGGPDQVSPPRADEPVALKSGSGTAVPVLDGRKADSLEKLVSQAPQIPPPDPITMPPKAPPIVGVPSEEKPAEPQVPSLPERALQWGRFRDLADRPATIDFSTPKGGERLFVGDYVIFRTAGRDYVRPERGNASFKLQGGEATIRYINSEAVTIADVQNGLLDVDFGKASFVTSFDLVNGSERHRMVAEGIVAQDGRFANSTYDTTFRSQSNNMLVDGLLSNDKGGTAAYLFDRMLDEERRVRGVTFWTK